MTREELIEALIVEMSDEKKAKLKKWGKRAAGVGAGIGLATGGKYLADKHYGSVRAAALHGATRARRKVRAAKAAIDYYDRMT